MGIGLEMDAMTRRSCDGWISPHLNQMVAVQQSTGDQLFIAEDLTVTDLGLKIAVGGRGDPQLFRTNTAVQTRSLQS